MKTKQQFQWKISHEDFEEILKHVEMLSFKSSYVGEVVPIEPFPSSILKDILSKYVSFEEIDKEVGIYGFENIGMHTDDIFENGFETVAIFLDGYGSLQFFETKDKLKRIDITNVHVEPRDLVIFDQTLPHSFSLGFEEKGCVALLAAVKRS